jgi:pre-mRNA-splicing factor ATP-dependent RNA helicase DHX38/PRP16
MILDPQVLMQIWYNHSLLIYFVLRTSWDEDDPVPSRRSSWDLPTPVAGRPDGDWSERSSRRGIDKQDRRQRHDETPLPTPAHKYNSWARDRKKTGATPLPGRGS